MNIDRKKKGMNKISTSRKEIEIILDDKINVGKNPYNYSKVNKVNSTRYVIETPLNYLNQEVRNYG